MSEPLCNVSLEKRFFTWKFGNGVHLIIEERILIKYFFPKQRRQGYFTVA